MKRYLLLFTLFCLPLVGSPPPVTILIETAEPEKPYERLIKAIVEVECEGDYMAFNPKELATGPFQIRPILLRQYNIETDSNVTLQDCFNFETSRMIFLHFASLDFEQTCRIWNGGPEAMSKESTIKYWNKVKILL